MEKNAKKEDTHKTMKVRGENKMQIEFRIDGIENKEAKNGRNYTLLTTSEGKMSVFDKPVVEALKDKVGKTVRCEVEESNGFKNIRKFISNGSEVKQETIKDNWSAARESKDLMMKVSYAKDIFLALYNSSLVKEIEATEEDIMAAAVKLIKQAEEGLR